jgi:uncharacterized membrane protein
VRHLATLATALAFAIAGGCASPERGADAWTDDAALLDAGGPDTGVSEGALRGAVYEPGRKFVRSYCACCHGKDGTDSKQQIAYPAFQVDTYEEWATSRTILLAVLDKWNPDGDVMPPPDAREPPDGERRLVLDWIRRGSPNNAEGR